MPEAQGPEGGPLGFWILDKPQSLVGNILGCGWAVSQRLDLESYFPQSRRVTHCFSALLSSWFAVRHFPALFSSSCFFCPFHWLCCDLVVVGERLG